eukprot:234350_1
MQRSLSTRNLDDLKDDEPIIDLTDKKVILEFANTVRNLAPSRRQTIWMQNVHINDIVHSQTKSYQHLDDILLFLIIIYGKEKYPKEEDALISKLKQFVVSSPFKDIKKYLHSNQYPLLQDEFISNNNYFAAMIEEYANNELDMLKRAHTVPIDMHIHIDKDKLISNLSRTSTTSTKSLHIDDILYGKLENKIMDLFTNKFKQIEYKVNNLSKEIQLMKYAMIEDAKCNDIGNTDDIMDEIKLIKRDVEKLMTIQKNTNNNVVIHTVETKNINKQDDAEIDELKKWIVNECELPQYVDIFIKHGIYNLDILQHITIIDLALLGIGSLPDRVKIMQNIQKLKYEKQMLLQQESHTKSM